MKDFRRDDLLFSLCGLNCGLCPMKIGGYCPGCGGGEGNQTCAIARCSLIHGKPQYCFLCGEFPCGLYEGITKYDSFITHRNQLVDMEKARKLGMEAYTAEQQEKIRILNCFLDEYNDGRRKSFYTLLVNLLDLADLHILLDQIQGNEVVQKMGQKERAVWVVDRCKEMAHKRGIEVILRKIKKGSDKIL